MNLIFLIHKIRMLDLWLSCFTSVVASAFWYV